MDAGFAYQHPSYILALDSWLKMRDCYQGEEKIKEKSTKYLPATPAQNLDGMKPSQEGYEAYKGYISRAVFPDYVYDASDSYIGLLHYKPAQYVLPEKMKFLLDKATITGESLEQLHRKINLEQIVTGRCGLLADIDDYTKNPYLALYDAESILNWDMGGDIVSSNALNLVILDESQYVRSGYSWTLADRYRVLQLGELDATEREGLYTQKVIYHTEGYESDIAPKYFGQSASEIPFVFINSKDISAQPDKPPLLGLANACLAIYRLEADYRQTLFMQGQDTLVVRGGLNDKDDATRVGAGARIDVDIQGDAKFIGVSSSGLPEMRQALQNDTTKAESKSGQLLNSSSKQESGDALKIRMASKTANLTQIAITSAYGLQEVLRKLARWMGIDPMEVVIIPNLEFNDRDMKGQDFAQLIAAKNAGAPLSRKSFHDNLKSQRYTKMEYEDEIKQIEAELNDSLSKSLLEAQAQPQAGVQQPTANMSMSNNLKVPTTHQQPVTN